MSCGRRPSSTAFFRRRCNLQRQGDAAIHVRKEKKAESAAVGVAAVVRGDIDAGGRLRPVAATQSSARRLRLVGLCDDNLHRLGRSERDVPQDEQACFVDRDFLPRVVVDRDLQFFACCGVEALEAAQGDVGADRVLDAVVGGGDGDCVAVGLVGDVGPIEAAVDPADRVTVVGSAVAGVAVVRGAVKDGEAFVEAEAAEAGEPVLHVGGGAVQPRSRGFCCVPRA